MIIIIRPEGKTLSLSAPGKEQQQHFSRHTRKKKSKLFGRHVTSGGA
jgi:hypothetical protein